VCNQQVRLPLFQRSYVPEQQEIRQVREETNGVRACHQIQPANKSTGENSNKTTYPWATLPTHTTQSPASSQHNKPKQAIPSNIISHGKVLTSYQ